MVVPFADGFETGCLVGETCGTMEVADYWHSARELIHIVYGFVLRWAIVTVRLHVLYYSGALGNGVRCVEGFCPVGLMSRSASVWLLLI